VPLELGGRQLPALQRVDRIPRPRPEAALIRLPDQPPHHVPVVPWVDPVGLHPLRDGVGQARGEDSAPVDQDALEQPHLPLPFVQYRPRIIGGRRSGNRRRRTPAPLPAVQRAAARPALHRAVLLINRLATLRCAADFTALRSVRVASKTPRFCFSRRMRSTDSSSRRSLIRPDSTALSTASYALGRLGGMSRMSAPARMARTATSASLYFL